MCGTGALQALEAPGDPESSRSAPETKKPPAWVASEGLAERTGLEPATPGVTGRYSNQLNYRSARWLRPRHAGEPSQARATSKVASPRGFEPLLQP